MKRTLLVFTTGLAASIWLLSCGASSTTSASSNSARGQERLSAEEIILQMDADKDGNISEEEATGRLKNDFSKIDTDGNGLISLEEIKNAPKPDRSGPRQRRQ